MALGRRAARAVPEGGAFPGVVLATASVVVGAVLALGGLVLLLRDRAASAAAILALVLGAGLVGLPRFFPSEPAAPPPAATAPQVLGEGVGLARDAGRTVAAALPARPPPLPGRPAAVIDIEASEAEPNDTLAGAELDGPPLGVAIVGSIGPGESDWFAFDVPLGYARAPWSQT